MLDESDGFKKSNLDSDAEKRIARKVRNRSADGGQAFRRSGAPAGAEEISRACRIVQGDALCPG